ncbi:MAG: lipid-A-disaccharide synthase [Gammaproteobacteria bacterium]
MRIGFVVGEASGDQLGAALIGALRERVPEFEAIGVVGEAMRAAGCRPLADIGSLSVMGLVEILVHLPGLFRLRRRLVRELVAAAPDLVVGIDVPDFNLGLERMLRARGIRTAHYVSPSVWAWRSGRVRTVARAAEAVLCLLPFEPACYKEVPVRAVFTGHPLADELLPRSQAEARTALGLAPQGRVLAVLPGSRRGEVQRLAPVFMAAAAELARSRPDLQVIVPVARPELQSVLAAACPETSSAAAPLLVTGRAQEAISASDTVLAASGTVTLETLLLDRPMVVAYRMAPLSAFLLLRCGLLRTPYFSLPNLVAGRKIVPELAQREASVARIVTEVGRLLDDDSARVAQRDEFAAVRCVLGGGAAARAAQTLLELIAYEDGVKR